MRKHDIFSIWEIIIRGKYIILLFTILGALVGFYLYRSSAPLYQLTLDSMGNSFYLGQSSTQEEEGTENYFFHRSYFYMNVKPHLKGVEVTWSRVGERVASLVLKGKRQDIVSAMDTLRGLFVKFQLSQFAAIRASAVDAAIKRILANEKSMVFFKERIKLAKESDKYYPRKYSKDSFLFQQVDILPPEAQIYVFKYRIANREATNRITYRFLNEDLQRLNMVNRILEKDDEKLGKEFCKDRGRKWVENDQYLKFQRMSICTSLSSILIEKHWEEFPSASPVMVFSWTGAGFFGGVFLVLLLGLFQEIKIEKK